MGLDQALEDAVADGKDLLAPVQRLGEGEQLHGLAERGNDPVDGCVDRLPGSHREGDRVLRDPVVEMRVQDPEADENTDAVWSLPTSVEIFR